MRPPILLIFGTSHVGKSKLAAKISERAGWPVKSTDEMARHPGRPWPDARAPVAEYYSRLSDETIYWFLRVHHQNIWPLVSQQIAAECSGNTRLILEGSALRPEFIAGLDRTRIAPIGLYAPSDFLKRRMELESDYSRRDDDQKLIIDKFIARSLRDNEEIVDAAVASNCPSRMLLA